MKGQKIQYENFRARDNLLACSEFPGNTDRTIGKLGLTNEQEDQLVALLKTLTDGYSLSRRFRKDEMNRITLNTGVLSSNFFSGRRV